MNIDITIEDLIFHAEYDGVSWRGYVHNTNVGLFHEFIGWSTPAVGAVVHLMIVGDDNTEHAKELYMLAEPLLKDFPVECRIIP